MSSIYFKLEKENFSKGELIKVPIYLDTNFQEINAVEVKIKFSQNLSFRDYFDGQSIINYWIEKPHLTKDNYLIFSGIIPGGLSGKDLNLIELVFEAKESGFAKIELDKNSQVLLNDGKGTKAELKTSSLSFNVLKETFVAQSFYQINDHYPPEHFKIYLIKNPEIFNNKYYIVFEAKDKQSGIAYYEVAEEPAPFFAHPDFNKVQFQKVDSPYILKDQTLSSYILVKTIDRAGNSRIEIVKPQKMISFDILIFFLLFLGIVIIISYKIFKLLFKKIQIIRFK